MLKETPTSENSLMQVLATPELFRSIEFLEAMLDSDAPVRYPVRFTKAVLVIYSFVDASVSWFTSAFKEVENTSVEVVLGFRLQK